MADSSETQPGPARPGQDLTYEVLLDNLYDGVYYANRDGEITYWNKGAERITGYTAAEMIGKDVTDGLLFCRQRNGDAAGEEESLVLRSMADEEFHEQELYLKRKDGERLPVYRRVAPMRNSLGEVIGALEVFSDNSSKMAALSKIEELEAMALLCPTTEVGNRRYTQVALESSFEELRRYAWTFGLFFVDVDHFKKVNDEHGHAAGDAILRHVAQTLKSSLRSFDFVGRWGGEEFVIILPNITADLLYPIANRCRQKIEHAEVSWEGKPLRVTASLGATIASEDDTIDSLIERADQLMYDSKQAGRNRVTVFPEVPDYDEE